MLKFLKDESGATAIEYGLMAALLGVAIVNLATIYKANITEGFDTLGSKFKTNTTTGW